MKKWHLKLLTEKLGLLLLLSLPTRALLLLRLEVHLPTHLLSLKEGDKYLRVLTDIFQPTKKWCLKLLNESNLCC